MKDDNESNSDDQNVWEGFDDLPERRELECILIPKRSKMPVEAPSNVSMEVFDTTCFINNLGGIDAIRDLILNSIDRDCSI